MPRPDDTISDNEARDVAAEAPALAQQDWSEVAAGAAEAEEVFQNGDLRYEEDQPDGELPDEDDDNAMQDSDEALPDDEEEHAIGRDLGNDDDLGNEQERLDRA